LHFQRFAQHVHLHGGGEAAAAYRHVFVFQHQYGAVVTQRSKLPSADSPLYAEIHGNWSSRLEQAVAALPRFLWETGA
jgi:predicted proteasome-type protease